jgi:ABC-type sugar transport system ATPase subunit
MDEILKVDSIAKTYPGVLAVDKVSFVLKRGEVLALLGENGAGKSTLMQIICGARVPDSGTILIEGETQSFNAVHEGIRVGVAMVFQELTLSSNLSVAENIFSNRQPLRSLGLIDWPALRQRTQELLDRFRLEISPNTRVRDLSIGTQQIVEILKAVSTEPKILILDEPTSSLAENEVDQLFRILRTLRNQGIGIIYTTHKLSEVFHIADRAVVMRDGQKVGERLVREVNEDQLVALMVGRRIEDLYGRSRQVEESKEYFRVEDISRDGVFSGVSFGLQQGEILGLAGLIGAGRTEVARAIFGIDKFDSGRVILDGQALQIRTPSDAIHAGIGYLTESRKTDGLFLSMSIQDNVVVPRYREFTSVLGMVDQIRVKRFAERTIIEHSIASRGPRQIVETLSGGNQQKVLLAEWLSINPRVLIVDEPTRGVDVGARKEIYDRIREYVETGCGVVMISSDLPEIIGLCDRVLVMHAGRMVGELRREEFTEEKILTLAAGISSTRPQETK